MDNGKAANIRPATLLLRVPISPVSRTLGRVIVITERCKECGLCINNCPNGVLEMSAYSNKSGYRYPKTKEGMEESCVNCSMCEWICPDFAIFTEEVKQ